MLYILSASTEICRARILRLEYGNIVVPWPVMWSAEEEYFVGMCAWFKVPAICQKYAQGEGVPRFGRPHTIRQRKMVLFGLCDLCAKPLAHSTKISLSDAFAQPVLRDVITQVEPLLHAECAKASLRHCPSLQRQRDAGALKIRQVFRYRPRALVAGSEHRKTFVPDYTGPDIIGLAAIDILSWQDVRGEFQ